METLNNTNPIDIAYKWENQILKKVGDFFTLEVDSLLVKHDQSFELEKKWRYWFYVKEKKSGHLFWVFASIDNEVLIDITTTDLDEFED